METGDAVGSRERLAVPPPRAAGDASDKVIVVIFPDGGRNYMSKLYNDEWLRINGLTGARFRERGSFAPTCNIAGIKTGYSGSGFQTVLPAAASAWLDFRLVPDQHPDEILALLGAHLEREGLDDIEVTVLGRAEAAGTSVDHPFALLVVSVAEHVSGNPASINPRAGGSLPIIASLERHLGVPGVGAPDNPVYYGSRTHAPNEHIRLEDLGDAVRFTRRLLERLGEEPLA